MPRSNMIALAMGLALCAAPLAVTEAQARVVVAERVVIRTAPPPLRHEVIVVAPGPRERYTWVGGYWRWTGADYDWVPGRWVERPRGRHGWVAGHWARRHGEYFWIEGHWR